MLKVYIANTAILLFSMCVSLCCNSVMAQKAATKEEQFFESTLRPQLHLLVNYTPYIGGKETYLRQGYVINAGFVKPFYTDYGDDFARVYSVTAEVGYGRTEADGALQDLTNRKSAVSFAVLNSLNPQYTTATVKKSVVYNAGLGLRQDVHFSKFNISLSAITGYQMVKRPAFQLEDKSLTFTANNEKIIYARAVEATASGVYAKPGIDLGYRISNNLVVFANAAYSFGTKFKSATQTQLLVKSTDNDAYLNVAEIRAGSIMETPFDKNTNMLTTGIGIKYYLNKK